MSSTATGRSALTPGRNDLYAPHHASVEKLADEIGPGLELVDLDRVRMGLQTERPRRL